MKLTREEALEFHRQMWTDMQNELGDMPSEYDREDFKEKWCAKHFPNDEISLHCFLCDYDDQFGEDCLHCPIDWSNGGNDRWGCLYGEIRYDLSPISAILELPVRKGE